MYELGQLSFFRLGVLAIVIEVKLGHSWKLCTTESQQVYVKRTKHRTKMRVGAPEATGNGSRACAPLGVETAHAWLKKRHMRTYCLYSVDHLNIVSPLIFFYSQLKYDIPQFLIYRVTLTLSVLYF